MMLGARQGWCACSAGRLWALAFGSGKQPPSGGKLSSSSSHLEFMRFEWCRTQKFQELGIIMITSLVGRRLGCQGSGLQEARTIAQFYLNSESNLLICTLGPECACLRWLS